MSIATKAVRLAVENIVNAIVVRSIHAEFFLEDWSVAKNQREAVKAAEFWDENEFLDDYCLDVYLSDYDRIVKHAASGCPDILGMTTDGRCLAIEVKKQAWKKQKAETELQ
jgi:hypothetical protein